jgi:hypothetical protein
MRLGALYTLYTLQQTLYHSYIPSPWVLETVSHYVARAGLTSDPLASASQVLGLPVHITVPDRKVFISNRNLPYFTLIFFSLICCCL